VEDKPVAKAGVQGVGLDKDIPENLPSIVEIKRVIPKHCLQPRVSTSMYYALKDFVLIALTYAAVILIHQISNPWVWYPALILYWAFQGTLFTAVFVVGHDCGHDSFSMHSWLNILVGQIYHGFLITPFYMWKLSHRQHHKNNANLDKDEVFYPVRSSEPCSKGSVLPGFGFGLGWFGYLANGYSPRRVPHFNPFHRFFTGNVFQCCVSFAVCLTWGMCLYKYAAVYGFWAWFNYYFVPLFIFASYCVIITFLHHSEVNVPWFANNEWDFVKGQLSTVDRDYGIVHNLIHNIGTHQMHHMFTKIPHYHLEEATRHFRQAFPELVRVCHEPILASFMRMFKKYQQQGTIADDTTIHKYQ
jgi:omega-3 fatty acid desaturase (delta-15 desaturase)